MWRRELSVMAVSGHWLAWTYHLCQRLPTSAAGTGSTEDESKGGRER